jgi:hydrogenase-4 component E
MTTTIAELPVVLIVLTDLALLASSRLHACIRLVGVQGVVLGVLPLLSAPDPWSWRPLLLATCGTLIKGILFPWLLRRAADRARVRREVEPFVGYPTSLAIGIVFLPVSFWMSSRLQMPIREVSPLMVPVAFSAILTGLLLIVSRRKAITQVLGYLVLENGIFGFGVAVLHEGPVWIELAILLDVLVAVFVMGIAIHHISTAFDTIDVDRFTELRDWGESVPPPPPESKR